MSIVKILALSFLLFLNYAEPRMIFQEVGDPYADFDAYSNEIDNWTKRYFDIDNIKHEFYMAATFYSREETNNNIPAGGVRGSTLKEAKQGEGVLQVATDPKVIPMYTKMKIKLWDGDLVNAMAIDIGSAIKDKLIDIYVDTIDEAINLGRRSVLVKIVD
jgi:3D (Asp-Asp-Asp) domain-containing protein